MNKNQKIVHKIRKNIINVRNKIRQDKIKYKRKEKETFYMQSSTILHVYIDTLISVLLLLSP